MINYEKLSSDYEEDMFILRDISNKSFTEIIEFLKTNIISLKQLKNFYLKYGKFPDNKECKSIYFYI
jgi:hypothetical protein